MLDFGKINQPLAPLRGIQGNSSLQANRLNVYFGLLPLFVFALLTTFLAAVGFTGGPTFSPPYLVLALNTAFLTVTGLAVAYISAKAYLASGSLNILFLGSGVLVSGLAAFIAGWVATSPDHNIAIYNVGVLLSSIPQLLSAIITWFGIKAIEQAKRKGTLMIAFLAATVSVLIIALFTLLSYLPVFYTTTGPTLIRQTVLLTSIIFFIISSLSFGRLYFKSKSTVIYWYTLALAMFTIGLLGLELYVEFNGVLNWVSRIAVYLSGFYFLIAIWSAGRKKQSPKAI